MNDTSAESFTAISPDMHLNKEWHDLVNERMLDASSNHSVILVDINGFKGINDELGHLEGNRVISEISFVVSALARTLRTGTDRRNDTPEPYLTIEARPDDETRRAERDRRTNDPQTGDLLTHRVIKDKDANLIDAIAGRVGGDEFAIYAATDEKGADAIRERLRRMFDEQILASPENAKLKELGVGMAIGASTLTADKTPSEVFAEADQLMYQDKLAQLPKYNIFQKAIISITNRLYKLARIKIADVHKRTRM